MLNHIDYSQYKTWQHCPWAWFEKYVNRRQKRWPQGMRDDALAIGSLVHSGLECWYKEGIISIPEATIVKTNPTPEALRMCQRLVHGYVQTYPREAWELIKTEQPLRFSLIEGCDGLAKIDLYFYIAQPTVVESGLPGYEITLNPGWWIQEYKTKSVYTSVGDFMQSWVTNMQADFQMLALNGYLDKTEGVEHRRSINNERVNGLLINILEKPKDYIPRRKCQRCEEYYNFSSWIEKGNKHACPVCGNEQSLKPVKMEAEAEPRYFRIVVERTAGQLLRHRNEIQDVAQNMRVMELEHQRGKFEPFEVFPPNREHCFDISKRWGKECDFFKPHTYGLSTLNHPDYEEMEDYINEPTTN